MSRLSSDDWLTLVEIARRAISCAVIEKRVLDFPPFSAALSKPSGAFVTLYRDGSLRGCVGQVENVGPLADVVARSAINAALYDTRFTPVAAEEITSLEIEISVLSASGTHLARGDCCGPTRTVGRARVCQGAFASASGHGAALVRPAVAGGNVREGRAGKGCLARSGNANFGLYSGNFPGEE